MGSGSLTGRVTEPAGASVSEPDPVSGVHDAARDYPQGLWKPPVTSLWMDRCRPWYGWLAHALRKISPAPPALSTGAVDKHGDKSVHSIRSASGGAARARIAQTLLSTVHAASTLQQKIQVSIVASRFPRPLWTSLRQSLWMDCCRPHGGSRCRFGWCRVSSRRACRPARVPARPGRRVRPCSRCAAETGCRRAGGAARGMLRPGPVSGRCRALRRRRPPAH